MTDRWRARVEEIAGISDPLDLEDAILSLIGEVERETRAQLALSIAQALPDAITNAFTEAAKVFDAPPASSPYGHRLCNVPICGCIATHGTYCEAHKHMTNVARNR